MTVRYLLDTNVISEPLRSQPHPIVLTRLQQHQAAIAIASVVWHELLFGCTRLPPSARRTTIERYIYQVIVPTVPILTYDERAATIHAHERARLTGIGRTLPFADSQIAAIAQSNHLILVTFNTSDYANFADLTLEDWRV